MTANHSPPSQTRMPASASVTPSRSAASAPSTTVGKRSLASSRKRPSASSPLTAASTSWSAATTRMPPVTASSTWSVRLTVVDTPVIPAASVTGPMRSAVARADSGRVTDSPNGVWPGATRSRSVPSSSSSASRFGPARRRDPDDGDHRGDADGDAERGQRRAQPPRAQPDRRRAHQIDQPQPAGRHVPRSCRGTTAWRGTAASSPTTRPSRMVTRRGARAAISRSWVISTIVRPWACRSTSRSTIASPVRLSRLPVGSSARTIAGSPISALAMATRWRSPPDRAPGRCVARSASPTAASASRARAARWRFGTPA